MATTTAAAIRDRANVVIHGLVPTTDSHVPFLPYLYEDEGDFRKWAEQNPQGAVRRYSCQMTGADREIEVTDEQLETHYVELEIIIAYPQSHRWGSAAAVKRAAVMEEDEHLIDDAIGVRGAVNFSPPFADATWRGVLNIDDRYEKGSGVDFLVIRQLMSYLRAV
jgi:hypothetical protein